MSDLAANNTPKRGTDDTLPGARLRALARAPRQRHVPLVASMPRVPISEERCGLCGVPVPTEHRHLLDCSARRLVCTCRACTLLFDHRAAGAGGRHYRLVPDQLTLITDFALDDALWSAIGVPVDMAFFFFDTALGKTVAFYPGAMGVTESELPLDAWSDLARLNPVLGQLEEDVQALLVNRKHTPHQYWLAPVDICYALAGLIRQRWRGFTGGDEVWTDIADFFTRLRSRAVLSQRDGTPASPLLEEHIS